jgi:GNAT superfamily N-acetyltransferase
LTPITRATEADTAQVANLISTAFQNLPPSVWLEPDPQRRRDLSRENFAMWVRHALSHGHVDVIGTEAAAVWFHRDNGPVPLPDDYDPPDRFRLLDDTFDAHHPQDEAHHHLAFLAVDPRLQNQGRGGRLLEHHHGELDRLRLGAFLESSTESNVRFYEKRGYAVLGEAYRLPDGPSLWPMWRPAHSASRGSSAV